MKNLAETPSRQYYIDWIRVLAMGGVFFFHNARFYDSFSDWHVKNTSTNLAASGLVAFMSQWIMPLFFLVAGAGTYYALKSRKVSQYARERIFRLFIPFIFGMLIIVVPQAYFQAVSHGQLPAGLNLFQMYWLYLQTLPAGQTFHLWFLVDLFVISIITLPLLITGGSSEKSLISRFAKWFNRPWSIALLFVLSIVIVNTFIYPDGSLGNRNGGWNIVTYLLFFLFGYFIFANPRIMEIVRKFRWISLAVGITGFLCVGAFFLDELAYPIKYFGSPAFAITSLLQALSTWGWLLAILGLGSWFLNRNNRFLARANEAVLPFYILHQTIIITIGFYVVQWDTGVGLKYLCISVSSFIAIMLIYELLVRHIIVLRFLFGMRLNREQDAVAAPNAIVK